MMKLRKTISGISLLEVLLSLSIIAVILVMATRYFFVASNNDKVNIARQQVGALVAAIDSWKNQNPQFSSDLSINALYNEGFIRRSSNLVVSSGAATLYDPWGNEVTLTASGNHAQISMTLPNNNDCRALLSSYPDGLCESSGGTFTLEVPPTDNP